MKKILAFAILLLVAASSIAQQTNIDHQLTKQDYLQKSQRQKTAAWIMLGAGTASMIGGFIVLSVGVENSVLESGGNNAGGAAFLTLIGTAGIIGSIPTFIASSRNRHRALSLSFKNEKAPGIVKANSVSTSFPALALRLNL